MKVILRLLVVLLMGLMVLTASAQETEPTPIPEGYVFTDASGTTIELDGPVSRVACVTDICNDILWELGLEPVAVKPNELAFRPEFWGGEDAIEFVQIGGSFFEPSLEDIASASPDLVIGLGGVHDGVREGLSAIAPLYIMLPSTPADSMAYLMDIGRLTDRQQEAEEAAARFTARWDAYQSASPRHVSVALVYASPFGVSVGSHGGGDPYGSILLSIAEYPFDASESQSDFGTFTIEQLLERDPDVIFAMSADENGLQGEPINEVLADDPLWGQLSAVQNGAVYDVDPVLWAYGRGTRSLSLVLDQAMPILYPNLFPEPLPEIEMSPEADS